MVIFKWANLYMYNLSTMCIRFKLVILKLCMYNKHEGQHTVMAVSQTAVNMCVVDELEIGVQFSILASRTC